MAEKTPAEKLLLKPGMTAALLDVPDGLLPRLGVPAGVTVVGRMEGAAFILDFAETQAQAEERLRAMKLAVTAKTVAWIAYPKGSKGAGRDLNRDTIAAFARTIGLVSVANFSVDDTWSALRVRPL